MQKQLFFSAIAVAVVLLGAGNIAALEAPHDSFGDGATTLNCQNCHFVDVAPPQGWNGSPPSGMFDDTWYNAICWSCHGVSLPYLDTHSSTAISGNYPNWKSECRSCHDVHKHFQVQTHGSEAYLFTGLLESATPEIDASGNPSPGSKMTKIVLQAGTPIPGGTDYTGYIMLPNIQWIGNKYKIVNQIDQTTLVIGTGDFTQYVPYVFTNGNTSSIFVGKHIRAVVNTPNTGQKTVKFFDTKPSTPNNHADGDTVYDGLCEVCHTQTSHWRNDGTPAGDIHFAQGGGTCTICHTHADGFGPFNHLAEGAVTASAACMVCHETTDPVADVHNSNCGLCHVHPYGGGPLLEPYETNNPSGGECIDCHDWVTGSHDEVPHTATPDPGPVRIWDEGGHDSAMVGPGEVVVVCSGCHNTNLKQEHAQLCSNCHTSPVDTLGTWNGGCQQGGCHVTFHEYSNVAHYDVEDDCLLCHENIGWGVPQNNCSNCHAAPTSTPPVTTSDAKATYNGAAVIHFSVTIGGKVGIAFTFYELDGGETMTGSNITVTDPGDHTLEFWSVDQSGHIETPHKTANFSVIEDTTAPVTTSNVQTQYWQTAWITLNATDASDEGVRATYYILDGEDIQTYTNTIGVNGTSGTSDHTLEFWSVDWSGNEETHHTEEFSITAGTATLRLIWGDSDISGSPCPGDPEAYADWEINRGTFSSQGGSSCQLDSNWSGIDDVIVPVHPNPYYVDIFWWDSYWGYEEITSYPNIEARIPGEIIILRY